MAKKTFQKTQVVSSEKYSEIFSSYQDMKRIPLS